MKNKKIIFTILLFILLTGCKDKTYTVTFNTDGGNILESITLNEGESIDDIQIPTKEGYLFVNWLKDGATYDIKTPITEDITLTANWTKTPELYEYYTVNFVIDDKIEKTTVKENETVNEPTIKEKENYDFIGWYVGEEKFDFNTKIDKDLTITAKYKYNIITIIYNLDGGLGLSQETIKRGSTIKIPEPPIKKDHKFLKWTVNGEEFSFDTKIYDNITITAVWEKIEYVTITFDTDGGNEIKPIKIEKNSKIPKIENPIKEGYIFKEWYLEDEIFNLDTLIDKDITLKAVYTE